MPRKLKSSTSSLSLQERAEQYERLNRLHGTVDNLQRKLAEERERTVRLVETVYSAVRDAASGLVVPPTPAPRRTVATKVCAGKHQEAEKALAVYSDLQLGKVTPTYNSQVAEERSDLYAEKIIGLTNIQRSDHPVNECRVYLLGDIVEGELIFPHQPWTVDSSLFRQVAVDGPRILAKFLRRLLADFQTVHVVGVIGNHGRLGPRRSPYNPETNMDRMLYQIVRDQMKGEKRLSWNIPWERNERAWYAVDYPFATIRDSITNGHPTEHGFLLFHGDQIQNGASVSTGTIARRVFGWASGGVPEPFRYVVWGHWHSQKYIELNNIEAWCNGSFESTNTYAQEALSAMGPPSQRLLFCHPVVGVSAEYKVRL